MNDINNNPNRAKVYKRSELKYFYLPFGNPSTKPKTKTETKPRTVIIVIIPNAFLSRDNSSMLAIWIHWKMSTVNLFCQFIIKVRFDSKLPKQVWILEIKLPVAGLEPLLVIDFDHLTTLYKHWQLHSPLVHFRFIFVFLRWQSYLLR